VYSVELRTAHEQPPRLVLALTHPHGSCTAMRFYPHSLETFAEAAASGNGASSPPLQRMGLLFACFTDGTTEVRALPKVEAAAEDDDEQVHTASLCELPGASFRWASPALSCAAAAAAAATASVAASPTSFLPAGRSLAHQPCSLAIGPSGCGGSGGGAFSSDASTSPSASCVFAVGDSDGCIRVHDLQQLTDCEEDLHITLGQKSAQSERVRMQRRWLPCAMLMSSLLWFVFYPCLCRLLRF